MFRGVRRFHKNLTGASLAGERLLMAAPWDGNVRELRNVIERACMLAETPWITERELTGVVTGASAGDPVAGSAVGQPDESDSLRLVERDHLVRTLERVHGNKSRAAQLLGVSRWTLYRLMERHGLTPPIQRRMAAIAESVVVDGKPPIRALMTRWLQSGGSRPQTPRSRWPAAPADVVVCDVRAGDEHRYGRRRPRLGVQDVKPVSLTSVRRHERAVTARA